MGMMVTSRTENAKRNLLGGFVQKIVGLFFPFIIRTLMIYYLGSLYLGLNGLFTSILQVLSLAELGFGEAMVFSMYKPIVEEKVDEIRALLSLYKKIYTMIGFVVLAVGLIFLPFLPLLISGETPSDLNIYILYLVYLANTSISYFMFSYKNSLLVAHQRSDVRANLETISSLFMYIVQIIALISTRNYYIYCIAIPLSTILNNIFVELYTRKKYPQYYCDGTISKEQQADIKERVLGIFIYKVSGVFRNSFDSIIISAFLGLTVLAQYQNYYFIMNSIIGFMIIITTSITAGVGNSIVSESVEKNHKDFMKFQLLFMWITSFCTVSLYILYQPFMELWVGKGLTYSDTIMTVFCIYFFTSQMGNICYVYRQAAGLWSQDKLRPIVEAIVNLILNIILVQFIGTTGVLLSTIFCLIFINCIWGAHTLFKHYFLSVGEGRYLVRLLLFAVITAVACVVTEFVCGFFNQSGITAILIKGIICLIVPNIVIFGGLFKFPEFSGALILVKNKILKKPA